MFLNKFSQLLYSKKCMETSITKICTMYIICHMMPGLKGLKLNSKSYMSSNTGCDTVYYAVEAGCSACVNEQNPHFK